MNQQIVVTVSAGMPIYVALQQAPEIQSAPYTGCAKHAGCQAWRTSTNYASCFNCSRS